MKIRAPFWILTFALVGAVVLSACGGSSGTGTTPGGASLNVTTLDTFKFEPAELKASAGAATQVVVKNGGAIQHNWVLVKPADVDTVDQAAIAKTGDATGIPGVLAGGALIAPGGTETLSVNVPAGTYTYLCTFPGHLAAGMKGTFTVQ
jgi:uncharacterized cupredoxin-like copper-binding protein